jgi:hypothetical protein
VEEVDTTGELDDLIRSSEAELERLVRDERHEKGAAQRLHQWLVSLRSAKFISQDLQQPVSDLVKPDEETSKKAPDLAFLCGGTRFVVEHTAIGAKASGDGRRRSGSGRCHKAWSSSRTFERSRSAMRLSPREARR